MGKILSFLLVALALLLSAQPIESQEFPFAGVDAYQALLRAGYTTLERFAALLVHSKIPLLADGGGDGGGGSGDGGGGSGDGGGGSGDGGGTGRVEEPAMAAAAPPLLLRLMPLPLTLLPLTLLPLTQRLRLLLTLPPPKLLLLTRPPRITRPLTILPGRIQPP